MDLITITRGTLQDWVGRPLTDDEVERIFTALPHSSVPEAIATIAANLTPQPPCDHPLSEFQVIEDGYTRTWDTEIDEDEKVIHAHFTGTEDWSDEGSGEYLVCGICARMRSIPDDYEIDWQ